MEAAKASVPIEATNDPISVNRTMPTPARALDRAALGAFIPYMNLTQESVRQ
jgi:hypothetical protein